MGVVGIILLVVFVIVCILMVAIVLVQDEDGNGLGGLLGGSSSMTFGSRSSSVLTKTTYVLVVLFFLISFALAFVNKAPKSKSLDAAVQQTQEATEQKDWFETGNPIENEQAPAQMISAPETTEGSGNAQ